MNGRFFAVPNGKMRYRKRRRCGFVGVVGWFWLDDRHSGFGALGGDRGSKRYLCFNHNKLNRTGNAATRKKTDQDINEKNRNDEDKRARPRLAVPVIVGRNCVAENLQRQGGDWLA